MSKCVWCGGQVDGVALYHGGCRDAKDRVEAEENKSRRKVLEMRAARRNQLRHDSSVTRRIYTKTDPGTSSYYKGALADFKVRMANRGVKI